MTSKDILDQIKVYRAMGEVSGRIAAERNGEPGRLPINPEWQYYVDMGAYATLRAAENTERPAVSFEIMDPMS